MKLTATPSNVALLSLFSLLCGCEASNNDSKAEVGQTTPLLPADIKDPNFVYTFFVGCDANSPEAQDAQALYQRKGDPIVSLRDFFEVSETNIESKMRAALQFRIAAPMPRCSVFGGEVRSGSPEALWKPVKSWGCSDGADKSRMFLTTYLSAKNVTRESTLELYVQDGQSNQTSVLPKCAGAAIESISRYLPKGLVRIRQVAQR